MDISLEDDFVNIFGEIKMANSVLQHFLQETRRNGSNPKRETESDTFQGSDFRRLQSGVHLIYSSGIKVEITPGNIVEHSARVDVIVDAANKDLLHGGGVALRISKAGGRKIDDESRQYVRKHGPVKIGDVACTRPEMQVHHLCHWASLGSYSP